MYFQISNNDYLPEFPNILLYVEANLVWMCRKCLYSTVIFNSKLDFFYSFTIWHYDGEGGEKEICIIYHYQDCNYAKEVTRCLELSGRG